MDKKEADKLILQIKTKKEAKEIGKKLGISWRTVYWRRRILKAEHKEDGFLEKAVKTEKEIQKLYASDLNIQKEITFTPQERHGWIGILFTGDWHLEGLQTDIKALYDMIDRITTAKRIYYVFMGDGGDYFCGGLAHGQFDTTFSPKIARRIFWEFINKSKEKLVAMVSGDHEWFAEVAADYNIISDISRQLSLKFLGVGGDIYIPTIKSEPYKIHARHRFRFNSSYNLYHTNRQYLRFADSEPDVVAIAHNHINGIAVEEVMGRIRVFLRTGTFKLADRYSQKKSYTPAKYVNRLPVVLFNLDKKEMRIASSLEEAEDLIAFLNMEI